MDFQGFVEKLEMMKERGWEVGVVEVPCPQYKEDHKHLVLRLCEPGTTKWLTPMEAVRCFLYGRNKTQALEYSDSNISLHGIAMAADYIDWLQNGYRWYVIARMEMLRVLRISEKEILKRAPHSRSFGRP